MNSQQLNLESTTTLESQSPLKLVKAKPGPEHIEKNRLGDIAEYVVVVEALRRGAEVFKNVGCTGRTDVVICYKDQILHVDVKTEEWDPRSNTYYSPGVAKATKYRALVNPETWKVRWPVGKAPAGWENFWD